MSDLLSGLDGVVCMIDDILVHGSTVEEHDDRLTKVLQRLEEAGLTLNREKCQFSQSSSWDRLLTGMEFALIQRRSQRYRT